MIGLGQLVLNLPETLMLHEYSKCSISTAAGRASGKDTAKTLEPIEAIEIRNPSRR